MASYNELNALIDAYINRNGVQAITGQILNGVLKAMVEQLGRGYTIMGAAIPTTDPGTPDGPECYFASETGTYTDFDGLQVAPGELALLCYTPSDGWTKATIYEGFQEVGATIDGNVGTPSVGVSYAGGVLSFDFHNMKGNPGQNGQDGAAAGFGTIGADITGGVGTPGVTVESSGPATAKNLQFHFTNLKGETGVTSVVATVDDTTGTPTCTVSLVGQQLTLAFSGLKGAQGDTGSSVDYPFTIVNNLTTNDATQALSAAMGVQLEAEVSQLEAEVNDVEFGLDGVRNDSYSVTGYGNRVGNYNFKAGVQYRFTLSSTYTGTLYLAIVDADGNDIRSAQGYSTFPVGFNWTPSQDYTGAQLKMGNANTGNYDIKVTFTGLVERVDNLEEAIDVELIDSGTGSGNGINRAIYVTPGYVYKLIISTTSPLTIYLNSQVIEQYRITCPDAGVYYIPVFDDGASSPYIRLFKTSGTQITITYSCYRMKIADFVPNANTLTDYVKSPNNSLFIKWVQGYWTSPSAHNNNASWCNTEIQFNRGRKITITYPSGYKVIRRTLAMWDNTAYDAGDITSGTTFDTANWGPWIIGVRKTDYTALTPEQAASVVTITQVGGDLYEMPIGMNTARKLVSDAVNSIPVPTMDKNPRLGTNEIGRFMHHQNVEAIWFTIPSQSLYDIAYAKALGFKSIEANVQNCSDGVAVIKHGSGGKLGAGLIFASGSGLSEDTLFSAVTSVSLRQNVTYDSVLAKYRGHIPTLEEFCAECARLDMIPFLRGASSAQLNIARKYLPDEKIIVEGPSSRGDFRGMMTYYGTGTKAEILATCAAKGMPFYYSWSAIGTASDADVVDVIQTLHANGYLVGGAYLNQNTYQKLAGMGLDIEVSTFRNIPPFDNGNKLNILRGNDSNLEMDGASYDSISQTISMANGNKITINNAEIGSSLSKVCVKIRYSGTLDILLAPSDNYVNLLSYASDGTKEIVISVSSQKVGTKILEIIAQSAVTIYDINIFASVVF